MTRTHQALPPAQATPEDQQRLWERIASLRVAMLTTSDGEGSLGARPVATLRADPEGTLWFFVARDGGIAHDLQRNARVHVCVMDVGEDVYVWLRGHAQIVDDLAKVKELWSVLAGAWFPGGPEDPNLALLKVTAERGDYWDVKSSKLVQFFAMATAAITHTPPRETGKHKQFTS
ncbi:MAG: pyridoxamine 5'-phosphate oxidase family protein [Casimicrobiaceae bacterium]